MVVTKMAKFVATFEIHHKHTSCQTHFASFLRGRLIEFLNFFAPMGFGYSEDCRIRW